jgi:leader peptidase (prepilin peptidase)/N-methyltransferase
VSRAEAVLTAIVLVVAALAARCDLQRRVVPNRLTATGAVTAIAAGLALHPGGEPTRLAWGATAGAFLAIATVVNPAGMGMGDAKLAGVIGLCLGAPVIAALLVACALGLAYGLRVMLHHGLSAARATTLPFAPCLAAGAAAGAGLLLL